MKPTLFNNSFAEIAISYSSKIKASDRVRITRSEHADSIFREVFPSLEHKEYFYALYLDRSNRVLGAYLISSGGITGTVVDPKIVFQAGLVANATSIILGHNHPSSNLSPSEADLALTKKLIEAGKFLDMPVLDHLILVVDGYRSFADDGLI